MELRVAPPLPPPRPNPNRPKKSEAVDDVSDDVTGCTPVSRWRHLQRRRGLGAGVQDDRSHAHRLHQHRPRQPAQKDLRYSIVLKDDLVFLCFVCSFYKLVDWILFVCLFFFSFLATTDDGEDGDRAMRRVSYLKATAGDRQHVDGDVDVVVAAAAAAAAPLPASSSSSLATPISSHAEPTKGCVAPPSFLFSLLFFF